MLDNKSMGGSFGCGKLKKRHLLYYCFFLVNFQEIIHLSYMLLIQRDQKPKQSKLIIYAITLFYTFASSLNCKFRTQDKYMSYPTGIWPTVMMP